MGDKGLPPLVDRVAGLSFLRQRFLVGTSYPEGSVEEEGPALLRMNSLGFQAEKNGTSTQASPTSFQAWALLP